MIFAAVLLVCGTAGGFGGGDLSARRLPEWAMGPFVRTATNPVITPNAASTFLCPMRGEVVRWEESDTFNPAAVVRDGRINVLYRAEDMSGVGIGRRTSRIGLAQSTDGVTFTRRPAPVMFPADDNMRTFEWEGGCEDPRVAVAADGTYVMAYTAWNRDIFRLCIATSRDLVNWTKHGPAFAKAYDGRFADMPCKSGSVLTEVVDGQVVIARRDGKYLMYWGENFVNLATSDNLVDWQPTLDERGELHRIIAPRTGFFDSDLTECGPPALITEHGILLIYNGKNSAGERGDTRLSPNTYSGGQLLLSLDDPQRVLGRLDEPFFRPTEEFEKRGQYAAGTVFVEGLVLYNGRWQLYYGCADSLVGTAVWEPGL